MQRTPFLIHCILSSKALPDQLILDVLMAGGELGRGGVEWESGKLSVRLQENEDSRS